MRNRTLIAALAILITLLLGACQAVLAADEPVNAAEAVEEPAAPAEPPPSTFLAGADPVQTAWFYRPPANGDYTFLAQNFDFFIMTNKEADGRAELRTAGVTAPFWQYIRAEAIQARDCDVQPYYNQVADRIGDYCTIAEEHPDWLLRDANGTLLSDGEDYIMTDPGNTEWREFWLQRVIESQETLGWDGLFADNILGSLGKYEKQGAVPGNYPTDNAIQLAFGQFLDYVSNAYFRPNARPLYANVVNIRSHDYSVARYFSQWLDGLMIEDFAVDWRDGYLDPADWHAQMAFIAQSLADGRVMILVAQGDRNNLDRQEFAFASYLLVNNGQAVFRYAHHSAYSEAWTYTNYDTYLGLPLNDRYQTGDVWQRDFENGYVTVNPVTHEAAIVTTQ